MYAGTMDYGDYTDVDICACGYPIRTPGAQQCKTCASRAIHAGNEEAYQRRRLANHRIRQFWLSYVEPDPVAVFVRQLRRQILNS